MEANQDITWLTSRFEELVMAHNQSELGMEDIKEKRHVIQEEQMSQKKDDAVYAKNPVTQIEHVPNNLAWTILLLITLAIMTSLMVGLVSLGLNLHKQDFTNRVFMHNASQYSIAIDFSPPNTFYMPNSYG